MTKVMSIITSSLSQDRLSEITSLIEGFDYPAILLSDNYEILATNSLYESDFGEIILNGQRCYEVSHGYEVPCDQAGESCPLAACRSSNNKEKVLHIHNSPRGKEHIDVELIPINDAAGSARFYVEILKPVKFVSAESNTVHMVGRSKAFNALVNQINLVAKHQTTVLLLGESGTGKEMVAQAIHHASVARNHSMITIECSGLSETLFESELFGHIKGAFTGATQHKQGLLEQADNGTLFLDEIGDVPLGMQVKLLRLIETGTYRPVGGTQVKSANFRLICATHKNLKKLVEEGEFREDLYYRINAFPIILPALRERKEDIALIANSLIDKLSPNQHFQLTEKAIDALKALDFQGNIRELRNIIERALIYAQSNIIDDETIEKCIEPTALNTAYDKHDWVNLKTQEKRYLNAMLAHFNGDKEKTAQQAGISLRSLYRKLVLDE
jgi:transcriptional regulator with PAS, ATPase and Fis domain